MMRKIGSILLSLCVSILIVLPNMAVAETTTSTPETTSPIILTEIQTGASSGGDEFIELYNTGDIPVDITNWQVRYSNATTTGDDSTLVAVIAGATSDTVISVPPHGYYVLHTATVPLSATIAGQVYTAKLSATDKAIGLFAPDMQTCKLAVRDAVAWGTSGHGEGAPLPAALTTDKLVQRYRTTTGQYADANDNAIDWTLNPAIKSANTPQIATSASPGSDNVQLQSAQTGTSPISAPSSFALVDIPGCTPPPDDQPTTPPEDPLSPPTDSPPATIEPQPSDDSNTSSSSGPVFPAADTGLGLPQITELLPNPAKPQTDAADEFIELYNANDAPFDLGGFILAAGKRHFTFPLGTKLEPRAFKAFFSADTHLTLSNTEGQVSLLDPFGRTLIQSDPYQTAKDGQAWALAHGAWYWTNAPTPNAPNVIRTPAVSKKKTSAKTASARTSTIKGVRTVSRLQDKPVGTDTAEADPPVTPIHAGVLALAATFALLYGAYEYRSDVANRIYQLRRYRAARREARQKSEGR